jgi:4-amino-4-deoxy-L-arabinose transferase-like glycosyltransferase
MERLVGFFSSRRFWLLFAAATAALYLFGLSVPLLGPDEPRYAQVAREMFERGDWVTTTLGGYNWFEKPALLYWLQIAAYNFFGINEFAARLGSALFGLRNNILTLDPRTDGTLKLSGNRR